MLNIGIMCLGIAWQQKKKRIQVWELKRKLKSSWLKKKKKKKKVMDRALGEAAVMSGVYECVGV